MSKKILAIFLIALIFVSNSINFVNATIKMQDAYIEKIGEAPYHLKYYKEEKGIYTYCTCSIVGYKKNGEFYPAYCLNRDLNGVGKVENYIVDIDSIVDNNSVWRAVKNGYPYKTAEEMGLNSEYDAFAVTKFAIYCLTGQADINLYTADEEDIEGQAMLSALHKLVEIGQNGTETYSEDLKINKITELEEEEKYYSTQFKVESNSTISNYKVINIEGLEEGDIITDENNNIRNEFNSSEKFKVKILKEHLKSKKNLKIEIEGILKSYPLFYGKTRIEGTQNYLLTASTYKNKTTKLDLELKIRKGKIRIIKVDKENNEIKLENVEFNVLNENGDIIQKLVTNKEGIAVTQELPIDKKYTIQETKTKENYVLSSKMETIELKEEEITDIVFENKKIKGKIKIEKTTEDYNKYTGLKEGSPLEGVKFAIYDNNNNLIEEVLTNKEGIAVSKELEKGEYKVKEIETNKWYLLNENEKKVEIKENNEIVKANFANKSVSVDEKIEKSGPTSIQPNEEIEYKIKAKNNGNTKLQEFVLEEKIPIETKITQMNLGTYNQENTYDLYYKTNFTEDYILLFEDISTKTEEKIDFTKELADGEYITNIKLDFGTVNEKFENEKEISLFAKVKENVKHGTEICNKVTLEGAYEEEKLFKEAEWKTSVYKILPLTGY